MTRVRFLPVVIRSMSAPLSPTTSSLSRIRGLLVKDLDRLPEGGRFESSQYGLQHPHPRMRCPRARHLKITRCTAAVLCFGYSGVHVFTSSRMVQKQRMNFPQKGTMKDHLSKPISQSIYVREGEQARATDPKQTSQGQLSLKGKVSHSVRLHAQFNP